MPSFVKMCFTWASMVFGLRNSCAQIALFERPFLGGVGGILMSTIATSGRATWILRYSSSAVPTLPTTSNPASTSVLHRHRLLSGSRRAARGPALGLEKRHARVLRRFEIGGQQRHADLALVQAVPPERFYADALRGVFGEPARAG
jgi:hypothetical protein